MKPTHANAPLRAIDMAQPLGTAETRQAYVSHQQLDKVVYSNGDADGSIIRPRLTEFHNIFTNQETLDFAIPLLDEDIPLYVDPFLLWKSPSQQDQSLHTALVNSFNYVGYLTKSGKTDAARRQLIIASRM
jgi:hypothetical protein